MDVLKVAAQSNPNSVSGAIIGVLERDRVVLLHAIGAGAVNQTVKAIAIACRVMEKAGNAPLRVVPGFVDILINGETKTGMRFIVER